MREVSFFKSEMIDFLKYMDEDMLFIIEEGLSSLLNSYGELPQKESWNEHQKNKYQLNAKVRHIFLWALFENELSKVIVLTSAKEI